jgi:hypothetical protein
MSFKGSPCCPLCEAGHKPTIIKRRMKKMYRMTLMSGKWYSVEINNIDDDIENITDFIESGDIVALTDDIDWFAEEIGVERNEIIEVEI